MANYPHNFPGHHFHGAYAGLNHDHDEYGGFHFDEYGPTYWGEIRCNFREKSAAASAREQEAKDAFLKLVASTPTNRTGALLKCSSLCHQHQIRVCHFLLGCFLLLFPRISWQSTHFSRQNMSVER
jgi:hypothetical protein